MKEFLDTTKMLESNIKIIDELTDRLEKNTDLLKRADDILRSILDPDRYFICGEAGKKNDLGLPDKILVCPTYGLDGYAVYTKSTDYQAPGY